MEYYTDASQDEYNRQYTALMGVFASVPGGPSPQQIRELVVNNPRESTLGFATLVLPAHNPAHQGMIYALHTVAKFATRLGQPATQWDNRIFGSINQVAGNQNSATIVLPVDAFSRQNGGNWAGNNAWPPCLDKIRPYNYWVNLKTLTLAPN